MSKSKKLIVANWKMNPVSEKEAIWIFKDVQKQASLYKNAEMVICPPAIFLPILRRKLRNKKIALGAQDMFWEKQGAFTGQISGAMLENFGVKYVILGHSEMRSMGDADAMINKKILSALKIGIIPILCVGETARSLDHEYLNIVRAQLHGALAGVSKMGMEKIIIAYEPVWALSSTKNRQDAMPEDALEMAIFIRRVVADLYQHKKMKPPKILYGGSVSPQDAEGFLKDGGVDGVLVGHDSLNPKKFAQILNIASTL